MRHLSFILFSLILLPLTLYISPIPPAFAVTIEVPADTSSIQAAINISRDGDTVLVAEGTYYENINFRGRAITLASHYLVDEDTSHIRNTIIDGSQSTHPDTGSVVIFCSGEDTSSVLCGFTITGGTGTLNQSRRCKTGGGIYLDSSSARIASNKIDHNNMTYIKLFGAGIAQRGRDNDYLIIENNLIQLNTGSCTNTDGLYARGGGIAVSTKGICRLINNKICDNKLSMNELTLEISGGMVRGGGIYLRARDALIKGNEICSNKCISKSHPWMTGGGIFVQGKNLLVSDNNISGNSVIGFRTSGAGVSLRTTGYLLFENNLVSQNTGLAQWNGIGGGVSLYGDRYYSGNIHISRNRIIENQTTSIDWNLDSKGGGIYLRDCSPRFSNNIFQGNISNGIGGAFNITWHDYAPTPVSRSLLINNTIVENSAFLGDAIYLRQNAQVDIVNSILWPKLGESIIYSEGNTRVYIKNSIVHKWPSPSIGDVCLDLDPRFADNEWRLSEESPAIGGKGNHQNWRFYLSCPNH
jgi:hypothetical protein